MDPQAYAAQQCSKLLSLQYQAHVTSMRVSAYVIVQYQAEPQATDACTLHPNPHTWLYGPMQLGAQLDTLWTCRMRLSGCCSCCWSQLAAASAFCCPGVSAAVLGLASKTSSSTGQPAGRGTCQCITILLGSGLSILHSKCKQKRQRQNKKRFSADCTAVPIHCRPGVWVPVHSDAYSPAHMPLKVG